MINGFVSACNVSSAVMNVIFIVHLFQRYILHGWSFVVLCRCLALFKCTHILLGHELVLIKPNLVKSRSHEIGYNGRIALKFNRHLGSAAAELPVKFQSDWKRLNLNLTACKHVKNRVDSVTIAKSSLSLKSPSNRLSLSVQSFVSYNNQNIKAPHHYVNEIHGLTNGERNGQPSCRALSIN